MARITVYTKPACGPCTATLRALESKGLEYEAIDLSSNAEAVETIKAMGYMQAPVVVTDDDHWSGFRPDKMIALGQ